MAKIIIVSGPANTGKTTSIKKSMSMLGIQTRNYGDITISIENFNINNGGETDSGIGFASGGDIDFVIKDNLEFFEDKNVSSIVFACRSYGKTKDMLEEFCKSKNIFPNYIKTERVDDPDEFDAYTTLIAEKIVRSLR